MFGPDIRHGLHVVDNRVMVTRSAWLWHIMSFDNGFVMNRAVSLPGINSFGSPLGLSRRSS